MDQTWALARQPAQSSGDRGCCFDPSERENSDPRDPHGFAVWYPSWGIQWSRTYPFLVVHQCSLAPIHPSLQAALLAKREATISSMLATQHGATRFWDFDFWDSSDFSASGFKDTPLGKYCFLSTYLDEVYQHMSTTLIIIYQPH